MSKSDRSDFDGARPPAVSILDFKVQIRSGQPCGEWGGVVLDIQILMLRSIRLEA
jgi:hypothetical protein